MGGQRASADPFRRCLNEVSLAALRVAAIGSVQKSTLAVHEPSRSALSQLLAFQKYLDHASRIEDFGAGAGHGSGV